ncbi:Oxysterol-binding protein-domain-containing protein [Aspergillus crustosus]
MAAMEELEVHSKSYFVRWVSVKSDFTISWSIQPHKKSLNFGIFKHPGQSGVLNTPNLASTDSPSNDSSENLANGGSSSRQNTSASLIERLTAMGLKQIRWHGKCEADKIVQGTYDVPSNEGGNYALVFDNTFSKQISKTVTLVLLTYPTALPPPSIPTPHSASQPGSGGDGGETISSRRRGNSLISRMPPQIQVQEGDTATTIHTGLLLKRRRKRHQGWARRFFSLDFSTSTLSYFHDPNSATLRGSIPLTLAAVACNEKSREISIDSGTEVWHLRARDDSEFTSWKRVLEKASSSKITADDDQDHPGQYLHPDNSLRLPPQRFLTNAAEEREWSRVADLVSRVSISRDAVRRLAKDTDPKYMSPGPPSRGRSGRSHSPHPAEPNGEEKRSFWKRKASNPTPRLTAPSDSSFDRKSSAAVATTDQASDIHESLMGLLRDLDQVVSDFSNLITESQQRRNPPQFSIQSRASVESDRSEEFFDAVDASDTPLLMIKDDSDDETVTDAPADTTADDAPSDSDDDLSEPASSGAAHDQLFPAKPKSLAPLPLDTVSRRNNIPAPTVMPPSLIGFLRKNVGKDLSTISMPVSSNEPLSMLQRAAEVMEYSTLLDKAAEINDANERLLYVTAFALSSLSSSRVRERAIRKPFNPMLGETFELVREDMGFRFVAEKVSHRPVQLAYQADSKDWSLTQSPRPSQKFWGKSAEIVTEGKLRITLHTTSEHFSWSPATSFLRNIIAGEKYVEPVGEMTVVNETTGLRSISTFKAGGMFSGRSEEVTTKLLDPSGREISAGLIGNWTSSLQTTHSKTQIWTAGPLVSNAPKHYGLTTFAASLNELTPIEDKKIPKTDSRLRPDQRYLEDGDVDRAEEVKVQLEEAQRARRKDMESAGENWEPRWFSKVDEMGDGEPAWRLKGGKEGYWEERGRGSWSGVVPVFEA